MSHSDERPPREHEIYRGKVVKIEEFGAFVELQGFRNHGLVHISQLSSTRVETPRDVVSIGDDVYVKVLSVDAEPGRRPKISLSMKYCDQSTGADKDRNGVEADEENRKRRPKSSGICFNAVCVVNLRVVRPHATRIGRSIQHKLQ